MRTLKEEIEANAGKKTLLNEGYKVKEMEAMSRAYSAFSCFARDLEGLKTIYDRPPMSFGPIPMTRPNIDISQEEKDKLREKLHSFCLGKLDAIKDIVEEAFGKQEKEDDEEQKDDEISISFAKPVQESLNEAFGGNNRVSSARLKAGRIKNYSLDQIGYSRFIKEIESAIRIASDSKEKLEKLKSNPPSSSVQNFKYSDSKLNSIKSVLGREALTHNNGTGMNVPYDKQKYIQAISNLISKEVEIIQNGKKNIENIAKDKENADDYYRDFTSKREAAEEETTKDNDYLSYGKKYVDLKIKELEDKISQEESFLDRNKSRLSKLTASSREVCAAQIDQSEKEIPKMKEELDELKQEIKIISAVSSEDVF